MKTVSKPSLLRTERLLLRPFEVSDLEAFAQLNADPRVMEYFPSVLQREHSDHVAAVIRSDFEKQGWGWWAVSVAGGPSFIGFLGLGWVKFSAPFTPAVEVGWRLAFDSWGKGYATEGARAALRYGFEVLGFHEIVSFTLPQNLRSRRVMEKLGMHHDPRDDFDRPGRPLGDPCRRHVLYRVSRPYLDKDVL